MGSAYDALGLWRGLITGPSKTEALPSIDGTSASMSPDTGLLVVLDHGATDVVDPLAHQQWTLAPSGGVTFSPPLISADGRRVLAEVDPGLATLPKHLLIWSLERRKAPRSPRSGSTR
jgi:hypothetical protein